MTVIDKLKEVFGSRTKALEILYLMQDIKQVVRQGFYDGEIEKVKEFCEKNKLAIETSSYKVVLADPDKKYSNKGIKVSADDPRRGMYFVYISKDIQKAALADAYEYKNDHRSLGLLLGYPECCVDFFIKNEPRRKKLDNDYIIPALENSKSVRYPFFTNICKRHVDLTLLNHFPCSFDCEKSVELAKKHLHVVGQIDTNLVMKFSKELKCKVSVRDRMIEFF